MTPAKITAAIDLLTDAGYKVTPPPAPVGRPRTVRQAILDAIAESPADSNAEIAKRVGCSASHVGNVRWGRC